MVIVQQGHRQYEEIGDFKFKMAQKFRELHRISFENSEFGDLNLEVP
jgi:hypothetical protein